MTVDPRLYPKHLVKVPEDKWPEFRGSNKPVEVWLSRFFLVQVFNEPDSVIRLTVNSTSRKHDSWGDDISWDELQDIKRQVGYGDSYAIEVYPHDLDIVNVANMRHLWVLPEPLKIGWFRDAKI